MLTLKNPLAIITLAEQSDSLPALMRWIQKVEAREDVHYVVEGIEGAEMFACQIQSTKVEGPVLMAGALVFHDYAEDPYWAVHT